MNDQPRHTLSRIIAKYGPGICDAPKRVEAMLRDLCVAHRREINIIMGALEERVPTDLNCGGQFRAQGSIVSPSRRSTARQPCIHA